MGQLRTLLKSPAMVSETTTFAQATEGVLDEAQVTVALNQVDKIWDQLFPDEQSRILQLLVEKIVVTSMAPVCVGYLMPLSPNKRCLSIFPLTTTHSFDTIAGKPTSEYWTLRQ